MRHTKNKKFTRTFLCVLSLSISACSTPSTPTTPPPTPPRIQPPPAPPITQTPEEALLEQWRREHPLPQQPTPQPASKPSIETKATPPPTAPPTSDLLLRLDPARQTIDNQNKLTELDLSTLTLTEADFNLIATLTSLTRLNLFQTNVTDEHLPKLYTLTQLKIIDLHKTTATALGLRNLTQALPTLSIESFGPRSLDTFLLRIPSDRVTVIGGKWVGLDLSNLPITRTDLNNIAQLTDLQTLNLTDLPITDAWLTPLEKLTQLQKLTFSDDTPLTLPALLTLHKKLPKLQPSDTVTTHRDFIARIKAANDKAVILDGESIIDLELTDTALTRADFKALGRITTLRSLRLGFTALDDTTLAELKNLTQLERLTLSHTRLTSRGLIHLAKMQKLAILYLTSTNITDAAIPYLTQLPALESVYLDQTQITAQGLFNLREAKPGIIVDR